MVLKNIENQLWNRFSFCNYKKLQDILRNIFHTKAELTNANKNFEFANNNELIDYYVYKIKSMQAQLDGLIKLAKEKGIEVEKLA